MIRKALDIKLEILPKNHPEVTDMYLHLARSLKRQGKFSDATKIQKLQLALQMHGEDHPDVVLVYIGIAELLKISR